MHHRGDTGLCNIQGEKKIFKRTYIFLLLQKTSTQGTLHSNPCETPQSLFFLLPFFRDLTLCDKSQHLSGNSLMTSFTLNFQQWAGF